MIKNIMSHNADAAAGQKEMEVLRKYFPQCFNLDGEFDIEAFKAALPGGTNITDETSGFNWLGKNYARMLTNMDTTTLICPDEEHNAKPENKDSQNVYISGDNLDALQHLVKSYSGKIKVIYIDPPYNTGSDGFVYNDKFNFTGEELSKRLDISIERAERILSMTRRGSASHAAWLTFMLPRLSFARDLLADDGVIFISIDDNEQANLKRLCDEVFGEENALGPFIQDKQNSKNDTLNIQKNHEFILCYQKTTQFINGKETPILGLDKNMEEKVFEENGEYFYLNDPITTRGDGGTLASRENLGYTFYYNPNSRDLQVHLDYNKELAKSSDDEHVVYTDKKDLIEKGYITIRPPRVRGHLGAWTWEYEKAKASKELMVKQNSRNGSYSIVKRTFIDKKDICEEDNKLTYSHLDRKNSRSILKYSTNEGTTLLNETMKVKGLFDTPKNVSMLEYLINLVDDKDCFVLDFFGGSSSTAHAILKSNIDKGYYRKFILVQLQEPCKPDSEAAKAGYQTIDDIGMDRIKRSAKKIKEANPSFTGDLGFKHYTLEEPKQDTLLLMEDFDPVSNCLTTLSVDDFGLQTVLRTWLVADGYGLTEDAEEVMLGNYEAYWKDDHLYMINPDHDFNESSIAALLDKYNGELFSPHNIVIFGYSFGFTHREELQKNLRTLKDGNKTLNVNIDVRY